MRWEMNQGACRLGGKKGSCSCLPTEAEVEGAKEEEEEEIGLTSQARYYNTMQARKKLGREFQKLDFVDLCNLHDDSESTMVTLLLCGRLVPSFQPAFQASARA